MKEPNDWTRYERLYGRRRNPVPCPEWQELVYAHEMGRKPPEPAGEQFDYNPRTKAGKELLKGMMNGADS